MIINRIIDNAAVAIASVDRRPSSRPAHRPWRTRTRRARPSSACRQQARLARNGRPGPTASRCASSTSTTPSWPPTTRTPATTSRRSWPSPSTTERRAGPDPRHRHRLRDPDRPGAGDLPARAQDRPYRPSRPVGRRRHRHAARPDAETIYQAVQQALHVTTPRASRARARSRSWKAYAPALAGKMAVEAVDRAMRGEGAPSPDLRRRGRRHRLAARRPARPHYDGAAAGAGRGQARHPGQLHQGTLGRIPVPGADRPGPPACARNRRPRRRSRRSSSTPATTPTT